MSGDAATDAEIARLLAEDQGYYMGQDYYFGDGADSDSDPDFGSNAKKKKKKKKGGKVAASAADGPVAEGGEGPEAREDGEDLGVSATGRRKRKDTGQQRTASRSWTDDEERLFLEALALHGRDWKKCADHIGTRDHRAVASHAQKYLIKQLLRGEELPGKMVDSGRGYTLSGKPLDPNSAAARAYGLKPEAFQKVVESGFLQVGVHVTTLELTEGPPPKREPKAAATATGAAPATKRPRKSSNSSASAAAAAAADEMDASAASLAPVEPTEYAKNRPRRQLASAKAQLGATTESLDLTMPLEFVGPVATGAPLSQPFSVTVAPEALLVMDFHGHLSNCEVIGLLGGSFDPHSKALVITAAYPCRRAEGSDSSTSVELDAESQVEVACAMEDRGLIPVGWYHSHPVFEPRPSAKDNENQRNYQALCRDSTTGLEPWVGAIVGPYDQMLPTAASRTQLWVVRQQGRDLMPYNVKHVRVPPTKVPEQGDDVEQQMLTALEHGKDDMARVMPTDIWRPYARLIQGTADGGPLTIGEKLQLALRVHLPKDQPTAVNEFLGRVRGYFKEHWGVEVPEFVSQAAAAAAPEVKAEEATAAAVAMDAEQQQQEQSISPLDAVKAEQVDPNNAPEHPVQQQQQQHKETQGAAPGEPSGAREATDVPAPAAEADAEPPQEPLPAP